MSGVEIERKFIIELPDFEKMREMSGYECREITQAYMPTKDGVSHRIRKSAGIGGVIYTETKKRRIDEMSAIEDERVITKEQYLNLFEARDSELNVLYKCRHSFEFSGQVFEIDVYPEWTLSCIMETELKAKEDNPEIPPIIKIIREVTGERKYTNHSMARSFPKEIF